MNKPVAKKSRLAVLRHQIMMGEAARSQLEKWYRKETNTENSIWSLRETDTDELIQGILNSLKKKTSIK